MQTVEYRPLILAGALVLALASFPGLAADLSGPARIIDGDTLEVAGVKVRLHGIDAPEAGQTCEANGTEYRCGEVATAWMAEQSAGVVVSCQDRGRDRYGRMVGVCRTARGVNLNHGSVLAGVAVSYRRYSLDYVQAEDEAREARRGLWAGSFQMPWEWRRQ